MCVARGLFACPIIVFFLQLFTVWTWVFEPDPQGLLCQPDTLSEGAHSADVGLASKQQLQQQHATMAAQPQAQAGAGASLPVPSTSGQHDGGHKVGRTQHC